jgi:hypothetical protein
LSTLQAQFLAAIVLSAASLVVSAAGTVTNAAAGRDALTIQIELEDFTLTDCTITNVAGASGGKAVLIAVATSKAETTVELEKGEYTVEFWIEAFSLQGDTVWVTIGDAGKASPWDGKLKSFPDHARMPMREFKKSGVYVDEKTRVTLTVAEDRQRVPIVITPKKTGMLIDRIVMTRRTQ